MIEALSALSTTQRERVYETFYAKPHAFAVLSSVHGYSLSELEVEMQESAYPQTAVVLVGDDPVGVIRSENPDMGSQSIRVLLDIYTTVSGSEFTPYFEELASRGFTRLYAYVLAHEAEVKSILGSCGFVKEVHLSSHVFIQGLYVDMEIWGTRRCGV